MPRNLPWRNNASTKTIQTRLKNPTNSSAAPVKRKRAERSTLDTDSEHDDPRAPKGQRGEPASSPPPSPPPEDFMKEGLQNDDKYRMVEDEFLSVAQKFTVHLHAAEYKKQQKMVQSRNAQTISSISRPAVGIMPDDTKRRLERIERSETQRKATGAISGKSKAMLSDDSDSGDGLPYVGTTLHGLMDNPRKRGISLSKIVSATTTTRAAAGYQKPSAKSKDLKHELPKKPVVTVKPPEDPQSESSTDSSDEDDDLNAPISAPKFFKTEMSSPLAAKASVTSRNVLQTKTTSLSAVSRNKPASGISGIRNKEKVDQPRSTLNDSPPLFSTGPVRISRFERARQLKAKEEQEQKSKKSRDIIPSFL